MAVPSKRRRLQIMLPGSLLDEIDERVGKRRRSRFIREAVAEKLEFLQRMKMSEHSSSPQGDRENLVWETREPVPE